MTTEHTPEDWTRLGRRLRSAREVQNLTRAQLADRSGVSAKTIQVQEEGRMPQGRWPHSLPAIASALGWTSDSIEAVLAGGEPTKDKDAAASRQLELGAEAHDRPAKAKPGFQFRRMGWLQEHGREALEEAVPPAMQLGHLCALLGAPQPAVDAYDRAVRELVGAVSEAQRWGDWTPYGEEGEH